MREPRLKKKSAETSKKTEKRSVLSEDVKLEVYCYNFDDINSVQKLMNTATALFCRNLSKGIAKTVKPVGFGGTYQRKLTL